MATLPKLKIVRVPSYPSEEILDLEKARYTLFSYGPVSTVVVEGHVISSYGELLDLATQERYKDREFLNVELWDIVEGG